MQAGDKHIINARNAQLREHLRRGVAQAAFGAVSRDGVADLLCCGKAGPDIQIAYGVPPRLDDKEISALSQPVAYEQKVLARRQGDD